MTYFFSIVGVLFLLFVAFIIWRITSVARGARQRDEKIYDLLEPLGEKLAQKQSVTAEEVAALATKPQARPMLYEVLKQSELLDLFPRQYLSEAAQGEAQLVYWMMHPNELEDAPEQIELVESITQPLNESGSDKPGNTGTFYVYRYQMSAGHWAGSDWLLGLAGPYCPGDVPYFGAAGAFSRAGDKYGKITPAELVDWYIGVATDKGAPWGEVAK